MRRIDLIFSLHQQISCDKERVGYRILDILALAFFLRVLGQLTVWFYPQDNSQITDRLPPFDEWQSGLLPYPVLLLSQFAILLLMVFIRFFGIKRIHRFVFRVSADLPEVKAERSRKTALHVRLLRAFSIVYAGVMLVRFLGYLHALYQGQKLLGGWIPIVFHWVLAAYLWVVAELLESEAGKTSSEENGNEH